MHFLRTYFPFYNYKFEKISLHQQGFRLWANYYSGTIERSAKGKKDGFIVLILNFNVSLIASSILL
jgi:hypothetical protein